MYWLYFTLATHSKTTELVNWPAMGDAQVTVQTSSFHSPDK
jgi:hypothetical protein